MNSHAPDEADPPERRVLVLHRQRVLVPLLRNSCSRLLSRLAAIASGLEAPSTHSTEPRPCPEGGGIPRLADLSLEEAMSIFVDPSWRRFCVVRHPVDRLLRGWRDMATIERPARAPAPAPLADFLRWLEQDWPRLGRQELWMPQLELSGHGFIAYDPVLEASAIESDPMTSLLPLLVPDPVDPLGHRIRLELSRSRQHLPAAPQVQLGAEDRRVLAAFIAEHYQQDLESFGFDLEAGLSLLDAPSAESAFSNLREQESPEPLTAAIGRGNALLEGNRFAEALTVFEALPLKEATVLQRVYVFTRQLIALVMIGALAEARSKVEAIPDEPLRLFAGLHLIPPVHASDTAMECERRRVVADVQRLAQLTESLLPSQPALEELLAHAWCFPGFLMAYLMDDVRELQEAYGRVLTHLFRVRQGEFMAPIPIPGSSGPRRVGVVSAHLYRHHGALWVLGWLADLADRDGYKIFCYHTGSTTDEATEAFQRISTFRQLPVGPNSLSDAATTIRADGIEMLLFPDIGMEPTTRILSLLRLAQVQVQGWGHPVTSGSPCMDAFLVGEGMETPQGQRSYTESLHLLPRTGLNETPPAEEAINADVGRTLGLPGDRPLLLSLQSSFKYAPRNDGVLVAIAQRSRDALILMVDPPLGSTVGRMLHQRLRARFAEAGLEIDDHIRLLPRLEFGDVLGLFRIGHHALDTIDWNGGNTSLQALSQGCPIVTLPTTQMRGRHTIAMLEVLDLTELIARDREDYVAISLRLLQDEAYHAQLRTTILERRHLLFDDLEVSRAFRSFVDRYVPRSPLPLSGP
ncbi:MAG: hypothetical protein FJ082_10715 [Cyanobacteria bacterium K_Offshore_surface_m2_011]|nr:hypothetical protein [Cyanobacteria bacterium K_Offshore_surface_m2_011]